MNEETNKCQIKIIWYRQRNWYNFSLRNKNPTPIFLILFTRTPYPNHVSIYICHTYGLYQRCKFHMQIIYFKSVKTTLNMDKGLISRRQPLWRTYDFDLILLHLTLLWAPVRLEIGRVTSSYSIITTQYNQIFQSWFSALLQKK